MKRYLLVTTVLTGIGFIAASSGAAEPASKPAPPAVHTHDHGAVPAVPAEPPKAGAAMSKGMGMMGAGGGMCPMMSGSTMGGMGTMMTMGGADTQVAVKNTDSGVTITLTAKDPGKIARLQKMAEAMRLMHEATSQ